MIATGIALVAIALIAMAWLTINAAGWKFAAAAWGFGLLLTALLGGGVLLTEAGMTA